MTVTMTWVGLDVRARSTLWGAQTRPARRQDAGSFDLQAKTEFAHPTRHNVSPHRMAREVMADDPLLERAVARNGLSFIYYALEGLFAFRPDTGPLVSHGLARGTACATRLVSTRVAVAVWNYDSRRAGRGQLATPRRT